MISSASHQTAKRELLAKLHKGKNNIQEGFTAETFNELVGYLGAHVEPVSSGDTMESFWDLLIHLVEKRQCTMSVEFINLSTGSVLCTDWCDLEKEFVMLGVIRKCADGYFRFMASENTHMTCKQLILISTKISELNMSL